MKSRVRSLSQARAFFAEALPSRKIVKYKAGETIIAQGDQCNDIHYIEEGMVKVTLVSNRGRGAVLGILGEGDFFGEGCITGQSYHSTSAIALTPCSVGTIKSKVMSRLIEEEFPFCAHFINYLLARNQVMEQSLIDHLFNSSEKRLARTLLQLSGPGHGKKPSQLLEKISQDTLAEMVGTTRSRVNFFMNKFRKLGHIHYNGGVTVHKSLESMLQDER